MTIQSKALNAILKRLQPAIHPSPVLPVLEYIHVSNNSITATNLNLTITHKFATPETLLLPFTKMLNITSVADGELNITADKVTCGKDKWSISQGDIKAFPLMPEFEGDKVEVGQSFFEALFEADKFKSKTTIGEIKENVLIDFKYGNIVGTDAQQLYKNKLGLTGGSLCVVDTTFVKATAQLTDAVISVNNKFISAQSGEMNIICRLTEGMYPDYKTIFPVEMPVYNFTANKALFIAALRKLQVDKTMVPVCKLFFGDGSVKFSFTEINTGQDAETEIPCVHNIDFPVISLNILLLLNILSCVDSDDVTIAFTAPNKGVYIYNGNKIMAIWPVTI